jgi:putative oxygen-independent coproporphyrinogen III oxidase
VTAAGIYVHIPFCLTRCGYCDFNAYAGLDELKPSYLDSLSNEADLASPGWDGQGFASVFLGGGTPTTVEPVDLRALLTRLRDRFDLDHDAEITIEANPDTVTEASLSALLDAGFTRISIGAQSFDTKVLAALERIHEPASVRAAVGAARRAGYRNLSLDLIYGATGETLDSWRRTLDETLALAPDHISAYALTIEPATSLGRKVAAGETRAPDPDLQADMFMLSCETLGDAGYRHYEISNWARPGFECVHNLGYWERRPYVGLGAGAHSYRDDVRWWNVRPPETYMEMLGRGQLPIGGSESLGPSDAYLEEVFLKLRILEGVPSSWFETDRYERFVQSGLLTDDLGTLVPTERGMLLLNELVLGLTA